jgi:hypothetical protein
MTGSPVSMNPCLAAVEIPEVNQPRHAGLHRRQIVKAAEAVRVHRGDARMKMTRTTRQAGSDGPHPQPYRCRKGLTGPPL